MRVKILTIAISSVLMFATANARSVNKSDLVIDSIQIGKMDQDSKPGQCSVVINMKNAGSTLKKWQFGFYMPRSLYSFAVQGLNPDLQMQICDNKGQCANLRYVKADSVIDKDLSQGFFTILEPLINYPLKEDQDYYIRLASSNQGIPGNISALPQSMFVMVPGQSDDIPKIYTISSELTAYKIQGYNQDSVDNTIQQHLEQAWQYSQPYKGESNFNLVPSPNYISAGIDNQGFSFGKKVVIHNQLNSDNSVAKFWAGILANDLSLKAKNVQVDNDLSADKGIIITSINTPKTINNNPEGYRLTITVNSVTIETMTSAGVYYAFQTLRQLWSQDKAGLPSLAIIDYPRFKYRGVLLDTARHYFSVAEIEKLIDVMAAQKLNTLHLHLSDDEAFRLGLPNFPALASIGASRGLGQSLGANLLIQNNLDLSNRSEYSYPLANTPYTGTYTPEDIKQLINYANANQITLIPEIDIPGHARALIKSYPEAFLDPNDNSQYVSVQGYKDDVLPVCTYNTDISVGNQFTATINGIVNDAVSMFNGQTTIYAQNNEISIGGDEVSANAWTNDTSCRNEWSGLPALEKSHLFLRKLSEANPNLLLSGWQQMVQNDNTSLGKSIIATSQVGHVWVWNLSGDGIKQAAALANKGYPTVLAYADKTYLDLAYTPSMYEPGFTWAGAFLDTYAALSMAISASQTTLATKNPQNIVGIEGTLWSENLPSSDHLFYMALPKMAGLAEAAWSSVVITDKNHHPDWQSLTSRLGCGKSGFLNYLNQVYAVNYRGYPNGINNELPIANRCPVAQTKGNED